MFNGVYKRHWSEETHLSNRAVTLTIQGPVVSPVNTKLQENLLTNQALRIKDRFNLGTDMQSRTEIKTSFRIIRHTWLVPGPK